MSDLTLLVVSVRMSDLTLLVVRESPPEEIGAANALLFNADGTVTAVSESKRHGAGTALVQRRGHSRKSRDVIDQQHSPDVKMTNVLTCQVVTLVLHRS